MTKAMTKPGRLIVISNRMADDRPPAGGLVFALHACLKDRGGVWIGSAAELTETPATTLIDAGGDAYPRLAFELSQQDHDTFYLGYANSVLWPLCHGRTDLLDFRSEHFEGYRRVNQRLARMIAAQLRPDDVLWVHDYHFLPLAHELRAVGVTNRIGFFLHIPFPPASDLPALSHWEDFLAWLAAFDLVGLQTKRDVRRCLTGMRTHPQAELLLNGRIRIGDHETAVQSFPIGIDAEGFASVAASGASLQSLLLRPDEKLVIGVDRLDYSKGLVNRFAAFGKYLDARAADDPLATLLQIAPSSRGDVAAYQDIRSALEQMAGSVNGAHAELDWTPIRYIRRHIDRDRLAPLYRRANVGMVTPLADGMNLVAKEFVAAQDPADPGVLVLSAQAGASEQMDAAVIVNPYDPEAMANGIREALRMPLPERQARHRALAENVFSETIFWWTDTYLARLYAMTDDPQPV